jgi:hypothetical protein
VKNRVTPADPHRVEVGRRNRAMWEGFTAGGLERLRLAALEHKPWRFATGPTSAAGKAKCAENGRKRSLGAISVPQARAEVARANALLAELTETRKRALAAR